MNLGGGVCLFCGKSHAQLRKHAGADTVVYAADTVLVQRLV